QLINEGTRNGRALPVLALNIVTAEHLQYGGLRVELGFLLDRCDCQAAHPHEIAVVRFDTPIENLQERRFARAVAADQADTVALQDAEIGAIQQGMMPKSQLNLGKRNQGYGHREEEISSGCKDNRKWVRSPPIVAGYNARVGRVGQSRCEGIEEGPDSAGQGSG